MKRILLTILALLIAMTGIASSAEQVTPSEYLQNLGFAVYSVGGVEDIGLEEALFSGNRANYSLCGCYFDANSKTHAFFWREADGSVYVAKSAAQAVLNVFTPTLSGLGTVKQFVEMCEVCDFSLGLYLNNGYFTFGMEEENEDLAKVAAIIADGKPAACYAGWDNYLKALTMASLF